MSYILKDSFTTENSSAEIFSNISGSAYGGGVSFTAGSNYSIAKFILKVSKTGSPTGNIRGRLYAEDGSNLPTGGILAETASIDLSSASGSLTEKDFVFSTPYSLNSGTKYCLVVELYGGGQTFDGSNCWNISVDTAQGYSGGTFIAKSSSSVWSVWGTQDGYFKTYSETLGTNSQIIWID